jgi:hypothetical protein
LVRFSTQILQFEEQGEKTGWTYIRIPAEIADRLRPGNKKSFRVKGRLDDLEISRIALLPMGEGDFIMPLNAILRKAIRKRRGARLKVCLEPDHRPQLLSKDLMECLQDDPQALGFFRLLSKSHQQYFSKWIETARTVPTRTKRITQTVVALSRGLNFGQMLKALKQEQIDLFGK